MNSVYLLDRIDVLTDNDSGEDYYGIISYNNLPVSDGLLMENISWQLIDFSGTALDSTELPSTAPVLSDWDYFSFHIRGIADTIEKKTFDISLEVTSVELVPEPATLLLFGLGSLFLRA